MGRDERPLDGRSVLVTRPAGRARPLVERLERLGAVVAARPTVMLVPPLDADPARRALAEIDAFDWVCFTSVAGVEFFEALRLETGSAPPRGRVAAIGPATADAVRDAGMSVAVVAAEPRSEGLGSALSGAVGAGDRVLVVRPEVARTALLEALAALGADVHAVAFYRNVPAAEIAEIAAAVAAGRYEAIVLTAPSTLAHIVAAAAPGAPAGLGCTRLVAIGAVTAESIRAAGLDCAAVADDPSVDGIVGAVRRAFEAC